MDDNIEEQEIYTIENKKYNVITRVTKQKLSKDNLDNIYEWEAYLL